jgi:ATP-binding cassette subfamily C protein
MKYLSSKEKTRYYLLVTLRALVGLLDLVAILAIGLLSASIALYLTRDDSREGAISLGPLAFPSLGLEFIPVVGIMVLGLFISKAFVSIYLTHRLAHFLAKVEARSSRELAEKAFGNGIEGLRQNSMNDILYAVQVGSPGVFNILLNSVGVLVAEGFLFFIVIITFALLSPWVALVALLYFALIGLLIQYFIGRKLEQSSQKITESYIVSTGGLLDLGEVIREATTLEKKHFFLDKIYEARLTSSRNIANQLVLQGAPRHIVETALVLGISVFIFSQSLTGDLSAGAAIIGAFLAGGLRLTAALLPLQSAFLSIKQALPSVSRAFHFLDFEKPANQSRMKIKAREGTGAPVSVKAKDVSFSYAGAGRPAVTKVSFEINPGDQVAFIGPSGAGKSTIADLILGLVKPTEGEILLGAIKPEEWITSNPGLIAYVPQRPGMVSGTIAENIALGVSSKDIDSQRLDMAINDSHLKETLAELKYGKDTDLGKRKDSLSGGQLQRIGLARALYMQPKLLVMDEATSALDAESENEINKALDEMRGKVTVVLIAHRLNTVQRADQVFFIEKGQLRASGTFPELIKKSESVKRLAKLMEINQA